ncbi:hypothetical protein [Bradyrhizobium canariense]|uniref:hypothetical protein n=1 Tax=Bradyrhizobium canariense TaxID=255045 RepID=UPI0011BA72C2|nr:hypothetical protein [Bradyrhizobium canariense]
MFVAQNESQQGDEREQADNQWCAELPAEARKVCKERQPSAKNERHGHRTGKYAGNSIGAETKNADEDGKNRSQEKSTDVTAPLAVGSMDASRRKILPNNSQFAVYRFEPAWQHQAPRSLNDPEDESHAGGRDK